MRYLLSVLFALLFITTPAKAMAEDVKTGVQLPDSETIKRLVPSQYSFKWVKFQYSLGSLQPLETWIDTAKKSAAGEGKTYDVLISVAKNLGGIETLQNPDYPPLPYPDEYTHKYCPWDEELEQYPRHRTVDCEVEVDCLDINGQPSVCREPSKCDELYYVTATLKSDNGYVKFRNLMQDLAPRLQKVDAVEIWNEPNLAVEWSNPEQGQGLGPVNPENYANFMICGIKGLKRGGYNGKVISAAPAPLALNDENNMNDLDFFNRFAAAGGINQVDAIGWHSNVTANIKPSDANPNGFQRFTYAFGKGKPVWLTEFGWKKDVLNSDESKARQLQAHYIAQAYDVVNKNFQDKVEAMFVWNFGFSKVDKTNPDFFLWDIEGTVPQGLLCQPNPENKNRIERGDTKYVQDKSLTDDATVASIAGLALIPKVVIEDASRSASTITETQVDTRKSFLNNLPGLEAVINWLFSTFNIKICGFPGFTDEFCKPNLSIGETETTDPAIIAPGKNTPQFASQAKILGQTSIPQGMELTPEVRDCNIGQLSDTLDIGNQQLDKLSEYLGTTTGFYGNGMPNFRQLTPDEWEASIRDRMQAENLNISNKVFLEDRRSADMYLEKQILCKGNYPNGICPFEPSPTPTP